MIANGPFLRAPFLLRKLANEEVEDASEDENQGKEIPGRQVAGMTVRITSEGKKGSSLKQWVPQAEPRLGAGGDQDHSSAGSLAPAGGNHGPCICVSPLVLAQTASLALLRGAWEKLDLEIQHTTRPPSAGISPTSMLLSRSLFMSHVTNVKVMFTTSTMQLPGLGWWPHSLTPIGPWHLAGDFDLS